MYVDFDLRNTPDGPLREFYEYWLSLKVGDRIPQVEAFQLTDIPYLAPNILVIDFCGQRVRYRYSGANLVEETKYDPTGQYMDEIPRIEDILERALNCMETGEPYLVIDHNLTWSSRDYVKYSNIVLPLANAEDKVTRLVSLLIFS